MTFKGSAHLEWLHSPAPRNESEELVFQLTEILGSTDRTLVSQLVTDQVTNGMLLDLRDWTERISDHSNCDRIGMEARRFFAAQTLATTVLAPSSLDQGIEHNNDVARMMQIGADGLFEVGKNQFETLASTGDKLTTWLKEREFPQISLVESPIGNSLAIHFLNDLAQKRGLNTSVVTWNAPRNDRRLGGRTIKETARNLAEDTVDSDVVLLIDDAITGSRFIKLFDAIRAEVGKDRLATMAMMFGDPAGQQDENLAKTRNRLVKRVDDQAQHIGLEKGFVEFPQLRLFHLVDGNPAQWHSPVIWGESDLIAGKRKVNLIFMLIDHCLDLFVDLESDDSKFRTYLEKAFAEEKGGRKYSFANGILQDTIKNINEKLGVKDFCGFLHSEAEKRFPDDYAGNVTGITPEAVEERWLWLREAFLNEAFTRIDEKESYFLWRAFDHVFGASFRDQRPRTNRDHDYSPYTIAFNSNIGALNNRLKERLLELCP